MSRQIALRYLYSSAVRAMAIMACVCMSPVVCKAAQSDCFYLEPTGVDLASYCDGACAADCGDVCECGSACSGKLLGFLNPSDHCFDSFISPMTNPVFFEDPRTLTEARAIYLNHNVPAAAAGGDLQLIAVQLRAALTERLSIVASKDGM